MKLVARAARVPQIRGPRTEVDRRRTLVRRGSTQGEGPEDAVLLPSSRRASGLGRAEAQRQPLRAIEHRRAERLEVWTLRELDAFEAIQ